MVLGKKRVLLALFLALTMVFSVVFGTVGALANHGPRTYTINVKYKYGGMTIANGPAITLNENQLTWEWYGHGRDRCQRASYQVTEDYANAAAAPGKDKSDYGIASGAPETVWFVKGQCNSETAEFQLSRVRSYTINVEYKYQGTTISGPSVYETGTILENASKSVTVNGTAPAGYKWAAGEDGKATVTIDKRNLNKTVTFCLAQLGEEGYSVKVRYINTAGGAQVGDDILYASGTFVEGTNPFDVNVDGRGTVPSGFALAAGEDGLDTVNINAESLDRVVEFKVSQVINSYSYIINVEYRYNGNLIRTGNTVTASVTGLIPLDVTVTPDASIIPAPYYLASTASKVVAVSPSNNVQTVVFELADKPPVVIPDDDVPLSEPKTGTQSNISMFVMGMALATMAIGLSAVSFLKLKKSAK